MFTWRPQSNIKLHTNFRPHGGGVRHRYLENLESPSKIPSEIGVPMQNSQENLHTHACIEFGIHANIPYCGGTAGGGGGWGGGGGNGAYAPQTQEMDLSTFLVT